MEVARERVSRPERIRMFRAFASWMARWFDAAAGPMGPCVFTGVAR